MTNLLSSKGYFVALLSKVKVNLLGKPVLMEVEMPRRTPFNIMIGMPRYLLSMLDFDSIFSKFKGSSEAVPNHKVPRGYSIGGRDFKEEKLLSEGSQITT